MLRKVSGALTVISCLLCKLCERLSKYLWVGKYTLHNRICPAGRNVTGFIKPLASKRAESNPYPFGIKDPASFDKCSQLKSLESKQAGPDAKVQIASKWHYISVNKISALHLVLLNRCQLLTFSLATLTPFKTFSSALLQSAIC